MDGGRAEAARERGRSARSCGRMSDEETLKFFGPGDQTPPDARSARIVIKNAPPNNKSAPPNGEKAPPNNEKAPLYDKKARRVARSALPNTNQARQNGHPARRIKGVFGGVSEDSQFRPIHLPRFVSDKHDRVRGDGRAVDTNIRPRRQPPAPRFWSICVRRSDSHLPSKPFLLFANVPERLHSEVRSRRELMHCSRRCRATGGRHAERRCRVCQQTRPPNIHCVITFGSASV